MADASLWTTSGHAVRLGARLASGGEGAVYALADHAGLCAKVYHPAARTAARRRKLEAMLARVPREPSAALGHRSLAWPEDILLASAAGPLAGFVMPLLPPGAATALQYLQPEDRIRLHPGFHFGYLLAAARNVAAAFAAVADSGCCVGDVNESNVMISPSALVTLIDCDSFQVPAPDATVLRCPVGKAEYTAPELAGRPLHAVDRTPATDAFGLAVLIFQLLMQGFHPFAGRWLGAGDPPDLAQRVRQGLYAHGGAPELHPPPASPGLAVLPRPLRAAFQRAFGPGVADPAARPSAAEWVECLDAARARLATCRAAGVQHSHPRGLRACPWCALARQGRDYFPAVVGVQVALPEPRAARPAAPAPAQAAGAALVGAVPAVSAAARPGPGAVAAAGPSEGRPRLVLEPAELAVPEVVRGGPARTATFTLRNIGRGWFHGPVAVAPAGVGVTVLPSEVALSPFHGDNEVRVVVRVDAGQVDWGRRYVRTLRAGQASARLVVTAAGDGAVTAAAGRYGRSGAAAAAGVALGLALAAGARDWSPAGAAVRRLAAAADPARAPLGPYDLLVWLAAVAACVAASRVWRLKGRPWRSWRPLLADRRWSPRAAAAALALAAWVPASAWGAARFLAVPLPARLDLALGLLLVPPAWLAGRALAWAAGWWARGLVRLRGAGWPSALAIGGGIALGAAAVAIGAFLGVGLLPRALPASAADAGLPASSGHTPLAVSPAASARPASPAPAALPAPGPTASRPRAGA